jgi:hypothetical protein
MSMPALDPKKAKANLAIVKMALRKAALKGRDGNTLRVGFAFAPGKDKNDHLLFVDPRKTARQLLAEIQKAHKDRKALCCGTATVIKEGGKNTLSIIYVKKLPGAERKMQEALKAMALQYLVKLEKEDEDEDVAEMAEEAAEAIEEALGGEDEDADAGDERRAADRDDEDEEERGARQQGEAARADDEDEDEDQDEDEDDETESAAPAKAPSPAPAAAAKVAQLGAAPQVWHQTRGVVSKSIDNLRSAIKQEYADQAPELLAEIEKNMAQFNRITERLDHRLAEALERAHKAKDEAARRAELVKAKAIVAEHIKYIQSEPLIAHIDANPFGVQTNVKKVLTASLTHMAKVIS